MNHQIKPGDRSPSRVAFVLDLVRWKAWYDSKLPFFLLCMYYAAMSTESTGLPVVHDMAVLFLLLCLYASFGYVVNSLSDRSVDMAAHKSNALARMSDKSAQALVGTLAVGGVLATLLTYRNQPSVAALFGLAFLTAAAYSLPPIRFKERGMLGLLVSAIAQRALPVVIVFQALGMWDWTALALCVLSMLIGLRSIIVHQIVDEEADVRAHVRTVATVKGTLFLGRLLTQVVFPLELTALAAALLLMSMELKLVGAAAVVYALWTGLQVMLPDWRREKRFSAFSPQILADLYYLYWPLLLAVLLVERDAIFWLVLLFTLSWLLRRLRNEVHHLYQVAAALRASVAS